jgi:hypothetical protein
MPKREFLLQLLGVCQMRCQFQLRIVEHALAIGDSKRTAFAVIHRYQGDDSVQLHRRTDIVLERRLPAGKGGRYNTNRCAGDGELAVFAIQADCMAARNGRIHP